MLKASTLQSAWQKLTEDIKTLDRGSTYRFVVLSTYDGNSPSSRYVVVRAIDEDLTTWIFTDSRSRKMNDLNSNPNISLCWYDAESMIQVVAHGTADIVKSGDRYRSFWDDLPEDLRKPYCPETAPGTPIANPEDAHLWNKPFTPEHFACIRISPKTIEVLELNGLSHYRAKFAKSNSWKGEWLAP